MTGGGWDSSSSLIFQFLQAIGGNLMTGSPISDMLPIMLACNVDLEVRSKG